MTQHLLVRLLFLHLFLHLHSPQMLGPGDLSTWQNPGYTIAGTTALEPPKAAQNKVKLDFPCLVCST